MSTTEDLRLGDTAQPQAGDSDTGRVDRSGDFLCGGRLPPSLAWRFGAFLGCDLSGVRLRKSRTLGRHGVLAATRGQTVYLADADAGAAPPSVALHVLAHELAHVAQQLRGDVRLGAQGPARARLEPHLEQEADTIATLACTVWPIMGWEIGSLNQPLGEPTGECLHYPTVRQRTDLPTDAKQWLARFNRFGRHEPELERVLNWMAKQKLEFGDEKEFVYVVRMVVEKLRRPTIGGNPVTVGIPYRDDSRGKAIEKDVELVRQGTLCEVLVLVPLMFNNVPGSQRVKELEERGIRACVALTGCSLTALNVHALYVSGGPHDHPNVKEGEGKRRDPGRRKNEALERHDFETAMIMCAAKENVPVLGVCGGSWRVAGTMGGDICRLGKAEQTHAGSMGATGVAKHDVTIYPDTMLHAILETDNYRSAWPGWKGSKPLNLPVNSVHWAHSVFPMHGDVNVSAKEAEKVNEAFESRTRHFQIGIQWHPEYAQEGLKEYEPIVGELHRRILAALGDAATDGRAARVLQRAYRRKHAGNMKQ